MQKNDLVAGNSNHRIEYVDILRAFGIILMIMGHIGFGKEFNHYIHAFHMPLFFIVTGFFYKKRDMSDLFKRRFKTLIVPYFFFGMAQVILYFIINKSFDPFALRLLFFDNTTGEGIPIAGALWFLTAMFFAEIFYNAIQHIRVDGWLRLAIIIIVSVAGMVLAQYLPFRLPWGLDAAMVSVGLIHFGTLLKDKFGKVLNMPIWLTLICFLVFSVLIMMNGYVNIRRGIYAIWPLFWLNAVGMTIVLWNLARFVEQGFGKNKELNMRVRLWVASIGFHSIVYLCLNQLAIQVTSAIIGVFLPTQSSRTVLFLVTQLIILMFVLAELKLAQLLFTKTKLKIIIGK